MFLPSRHGRQAIKFFPPVLHLWSPTLISNKAPEIGAEPRQNWMAHTSKLSTLDSKALKKSQYMNPQKPMPCSRLTALEANSERRLLLTPGSTCSALAAVTVVIR